MAAIPQIVARTVGGIIADARSARGTMRARVPEAGADGGFMADTGPMPGPSSMGMDTMGVATGAGMRVGGVATTSNDGSIIQPDIVVIAPRDLVDIIGSLTALEFYNIRTRAQIENLDAPAENARIREYARSRPILGMNERGSFYSSYLLQSSLTERYGFNSFPNRGYSYGGKDYISVDAARRDNPGMQFLNAPQGSNAATGPRLSMIDGGFGGTLYVAAYALNLDANAQDLAYGLGNAADGLSVGARFRPRRTTINPLLTSSSPSISRQLAPFAAERAAIDGASTIEARGGVYVLRDAEGTVVRSGRTNNLARREAEHLRDPNLAEYQFETAYRTDVYAEQRGLEQVLHDQYNPTLNIIRPINPSNKNRLVYMNAVQS